MKLDYVIYREKLNSETDKQLQKKLLERSRLWLGRRSFEEIIGRIPRKKVAYVHKYHHYKTGTKIIIVVNVKHGQK